MSIIIHYQCNDYDMDSKSGCRCSLEITDKHSVKLSPITHKTALDISSVVCNNAFID